MKFIKLSGKCKKCGKPFRKCKCPSIKDIVYNREIKYKEGYTLYEAKLLCIDLQIDFKTFCEKLGVNTGMIIDGESIIYHCDVLKGVNCTLENRNQTLEEWD